MLLLSRRFKPFFFSTNAHFLPFKMSTNTLSLAFLCRNKTKIICLLVLICVGLGVYSLSRSALSSLEQIQCTRTESVAVIKELCALYSHGKVAGNLCHAMCNRGNIVFKQCLNNKDGKHVLLVDCTDSCEIGQTIPAVLKMTHIKDKDVTKYLKSIDKDLFDIFTYIKVFDGNIHLVDYLIDYKHLIHKLEERLYDEFAYKVEGGEDILKKIWGEDHMEFQELNNDNPTYPLKFVRTLWALLAQNEYKMSVVFKEFNMFPEIHGFCGPLYLSEYAPFNAKLDRRIEHPDKILWKNRATMAVHILNLVHAADSLQTPVHFCDVKTPHFGLTPDGEVRFTDSDTIFNNDTLNMILKTTPCNTDKDCAFFDCFGACNVVSGLCEPYRTNNNLQSVCSRILIDDKANVYEGILANPPEPVARRLQDLLKDCANGVTGHIGKVAIQKPSYDLLTVMRNALLDSLD